MATAGFSWQDRHLLLQLYLQPRASRNEWCGFHDGRIKLRLTAPPVENQANQACIAFLAKALQVPKSHITILSGHTSRHKTLQIKNADPERWQEILANEIL